MASYSSNDQNSAAANSAQTALRVWKSLGLKQDPFSKAAKPKVHMQEWLAQAELIEHLLQYSNVLITVAAERGCGKTSFVKFIDQHISNSCRSIMLQAKPHLHAADFQQAIIDAYHLNSLDDAGESQQQQVQNMLEQLYHQNQQAVVIVDNAQLLPDDSLALIGKIIAEQHDDKLCVHFLLAGEPPLIKQIKQANHTLPKVLDDMHQIILPRLSVDEVKHYIEQRFANVSEDKAANLPFDDKLYAHIHNMSQGKLSELDRVSQQVLHTQLEEAIHGKPVNSLSHLLFTIVSLLLLTGAIVVVGLGIKSKLVQKPKLVHTIRDLSSQEPKQPAAVMPGIPQNLKFETTPSKLQVQPAKPIQNKSQQDKVSTKQSSTMTVPAETKLLSEAAARQIAWEASTFEMQQSMEKTAVIDDLLKLPEVTAVTTRHSRAQQILAKHVATNSPHKTKHHHAATHKATKFYYAIQLLAARQPSTLQSFVKTHGLKHKTHLWTTKYQGKPWHTLLYGRFTKQSQAEHVLAKLPGNLRRYHPWVRTVPNSQVS